MDTFDWFNNTPLDLTSEISGTWQREVFRPEPEEYETEIFAERHTWRISVSPHFVETLKSSFPVTTETEFNLLVSLLLAVDRTKPNAPIVMPWDTIASCMGYEWDNYRNYLRGENATGKVLRRFLRSVLPGTTVKSHSIDHHRARLIFGVAESIGYKVLDIRDAEFSRSRNSPEKLISLSLTPSPDKSPSQRSKVLNRLRGQIEDFIEKHSFPAQKRLIRYMNGLNPKTFTIPATHFHEAECAIASWPDEKRRYRARLKLASIASNPIPMYRPSSRGATARIFTFGHSLATINGKLRSILKPNWIELDLTSAHLAIVSIDWDLPKVKEFLTEGKNIWADLYRYAPFEKHGIAPSLAKPLLKQALYSLVYGASNKKVRFSDKSCGRITLKKMTDAF